MDNKRNSERDKILEEILNDVSSDRKKAPEKNAASKKTDPRKQNKTDKASTQKKNHQKPSLSGEKSNKTKKQKKDKTQSIKSSSAQNQEKELKSAANEQKTDDRKTAASEDRTVSIKVNEQLTAREIIKKSIEDEGTADNVPESRPDPTSVINSTALPDSAPAGVPDTLSAPGRPSARTEKPVKKEPVSNEKRRARKKRRKKKKRSARLPVVLILTTVILTISICLSIFIIAVGRDMLAIGKDESIKMVTIPEGINTAAEVADILKENEIIEMPRIFAFVARLGGNDTSFKPGQYKLSPSYAYETIINKLTTEPDKNKKTVDVTFVEGISIFDAAKLLEEKKVCDAKEFISYFNAGGYGFEFEKKLPASNALKFYRMEGYLWPDTYKFYVESDPESVCMKIYQNFEDKMTEKYYNQMKKMGMTLDEVVTLASIVQAEAPDLESMKKVASVFENRIKSSEFSMLQSDPTTYYVEEIIKPNIQIPSTEMFEAYDTYKLHDKDHMLPPGAIGNPGKDAIEAVLFPADTDFYYFAADIDTKKIYYAKTLEEHEANLAEINGETVDDDEDGEDGEGGENGYDDYYGYDE